MNVRFESCATNTNMCPRGDRKLWAVHNFMMWWCWVFAMAITICSARYFRHYWRKSIYIHTIFGGVILVVTATAVAMAWHRNYMLSGGMYLAHWSKWSALFEEIASIYAFCLCLSGMLAWFYRRFGQYEWKTT